MLYLQTATLKARAATGDKHIGTRAVDGLIDVVRAVPVGGGRYDVTVLRGGLTQHDAVKFLEAMRSAA